MEITNYQLEMKEMKDNGWKFILLSYTSAVK